LRRELSIKFIAAQVESLQTLHASPRGGKWGFELVISQGDILNAS
jgi:hypothetical protein